MSKIDEWQVFCWVPELCRLRGVGKSCIEAALLLGLGAPRLLHLGFKCKFRRPSAPVSTQLACSRGLGPDRARDLARGLRGLGGGPSVAECAPAGLKARPNRVDALFFQHRGWNYDTGPFLPHRTPRLVPSNPGVPTPTPPPGALLCPPWRVASRQAHGPCCAATEINKLFERDFD